MWPSPVIFIWRPLSSLCVCIKAMWKWLCLPCITFFLNYVFCSGDVAVLLDFSMVCDVCLVCVCTFSWVRVSSRLRNLCLQLWSSVWSCSDRAARSRAQSSSSRSARMPLTSPCRERFCMRADTHTHTRRHRYTDTFIHQLGWGQRRLWTDQECSKANVDKVWYMRKEMCACIQSWNVLTRIEKNWKDPYGKEQEL